MVNLLKHRINKCVHMKIHRGSMDKGELEYQRRSGIVKSTIWPPAICGSAAVKLPTNAISECDE